MIPYVKFKVPNSELRKSSHRRGYTRTWYRVRGLYLKHHPLCSIPDCTAFATEVDHKKRIEAGGDMYDWDNLQALCKSCHSKKTVREDGGFGRAKSSHD